MMGFQATAESKSMSMKKTANDQIAKSLLNSAGLSKSSRDVPGGGFAPISE
jgi:hypothetical protein